MTYDLLRKSYDAKWVENPIILSYFRTLEEVCELLKAKPLSSERGFIDIILE
jgi:hypothetical protein